MTERTKYNGPCGSAPERSGRPSTPAEDREWLRRANEDKQRDFERSKARSAIIALTQKRDEALRVNDLGVADALSIERAQMLNEFNERFELRGKDKS